MKRIVCFFLCMAMTLGIFCQERPINFILSLDGGLPLRLNTGRWAGLFGHSFLALTGQVRVTKNFFTECLFDFYPQPFPEGISTDDWHSVLFAVETNALWKFLPRRKLNPFLKLGLAYAWEVTHAPLDRVTWVSGDFIYLISFGEGANGLYGKLFAGMGVNI